MQNAKCKMQKPGMGELLMPGEVNAKCSRVFPDKRFSNAALSE